MSYFEAAQSPGIPIESLVPELCKYIGLVRETLSGIKPDEEQHWCQSRLHCEPSPSILPWIYHMSDRTALRTQCHHVNNVLEPPASTINQSTQFKIQTQCSPTPIQSFPQLKLPRPATSPSSSSRNFQVQFIARKISVQIPNLSCVAKP